MSRRRSGDERTRLNNGLATQVDPQPPFEKLTKIDPKLVGTARYIVFRIEAVATQRDLFAGIFWMIEELRPPPALAPNGSMSRLNESRRTSLHSAYANSCIRLAGAIPGARQCNRAVPIG